MSEHKELEVPLLYHKPVLVEEVLTYLNPQPGKTYLDVTFGTGGHTKALLDREPECRVIAMDWDQTVLELYGLPLQEQYGDRLRIVWGNFALLYKLLKRHGVGSVDGILADFGASQIQLAQRPGFSFRTDTALDMRMSPPHQKVTAAELLNQADPAELLHIFLRYSQESFSRKIVAAIVEERKKAPFKTTLQLAQLVKKVVPPHAVKPGRHPATKIFQALRIFINKEFENIESFLPVALKTLNPQGRLACITFHSLEDRLIKQFFRDQEAMGEYKVLTKSGIHPTEQEVADNPSARSAKLHVIERVSRN